MLIPLYLILYAAAAFHMWHYYPLLPEKMATHFGADGKANGWMSRDAFATFHFGMLFFTSAVFCGLGTLMRFVPDCLINVPNKKYWLAPERRAETLKSTGRDLAALGLVTGVFIISIDQMLIGAALDGAGALNLGTLFFFTGAFIACIIAFIVRQYVRFRLPEGNNP